MRTTTHLAGQAQRQLGPRGQALRGRLFERIMERVHRYFVKLVWDPAAVDDCTQATLLKLEEALQQGQYDPRQSFNRWMWLKAHSVFVDYCRAHDARPGQLDPGTELVGADGVTPTERELDREAVLAALRRELEPETFEAFVLHYDLEEPIVRIAAILGRCRKTVRQRLRKAERAALRLLEPKDAEEVDRA